MIGDGATEVAFPSRQQASRCAANARCSSEYESFWLPMKIRMQIGYSESQQFLELLQFPQNALDHMFLRFDLIAVSLAIRMADFSAQFGQNARQDFCKCFFFLIAKFQLWHSHVPKR